MNIKKTLVFFVIALILGSCEMHKRRYSSGFSIQWHVFQNGKQKVAPVALEDIQKHDGEFQHWPLSNSFSDDFTFTSRELVDRVENLVTVDPLINTVLPELRREDETTPIRHHDFVDQVEGKSTMKTSSGSVGTEKNTANGDLWAFSAFILALGGWFGFTRTSKKKLKRMTRWAKNNPKRAIAVLAPLQTVALVLGFEAGYSLQELNFGMSEVGAGIAAGAFALGMLSIPFLPGKKFHIDPKKLARRRLGFLVASMSAFILSMHLGNTLPTQLEGSIAADVFEQVDAHSLGAFGATDGVETPEDDHWRKSLTTVVVVLGVLLILLSVILFCAGVCGIVWAVFLIAESLVIEAIGVLLASLLVLFLAYWGVKSAIKEFET